MNLSVVKKQFALFLLLLVFFFSACTKIVTTDIGSGLIPPIDGVNTKEMYLDVVSKNVKDTFTKVYISDDHALGYVNDPLFGQTTASVNLQLKPSFPFYFPASKENLFLDSIVLVLSYKGAWGDTTTDLSMRVFEIPPDLPLGVFKHDSLYSTIAVVPAETEVTDVPELVNISKLTDSVYPFNEASANQLRIRLNSDYGEKLLKNYDTTNAYSNDSLFNIYIKGLQVRPDATGNSLLKINLLDTNTKLAIYFRFKDTANVMDTSVRYFHCNYSCSSSNYIQRNRSTKEVETYLPPSSDGKLSDSLIFIDANPGIYARLQIPGLDTGTMTNKIIHRAEILMEQVPDMIYSSDTYLTPPNLFITPYSQDSSRRFALPNDVQLSSGYVANQSSFGCYPLKKTDLSTGRLINAYSFDISRYVQGIITRHEKSYPLILYAPSVRDFIYAAETSILPAFTGVIASDGITYIPLNAPAFGRVRLGGGDNSIHKMRLHIVYSDL
jgi:hypothetical protein